MLLGLGALSAVFASAVLGKPPGGSPTPSHEFRFIGFTDDAFIGLPETIDGDEEMLAMHPLRQDIFGLDAGFDICDVLAAAAATEAAAGGAITDWDENAIDLFPGMAA